MQNAMNWLRAWAIMGRAAIRYVAGYGGDGELEFEVNRARRLVGRGPIHEEPHRD